VIDPPLAHSARAQGLSHAADRTYGVGPPETPGGDAAGAGYSITEVLAILHRLGYRPATLPELLAFSMRYSETSREAVVVELGSLEALPRGEYGYVNSLKGYLEIRYDGEGDFNGVEFLAVRQ
jgi:hypothetical protein